MKEHFKNLWFRDTEEDMKFIRRDAVKLRAGILLLLPIYMLIIVFTTVLAPLWTVIPNTMAVETFDVFDDFRIVYDVQAYRTMFEYSVPTLVLIYGLFEMLSGLSVKTSYLSPTVHLATFLTRNNPEKWEPYQPKKFAWLIGASLILGCLVFLNPDSVARFINSIVGNQLLPTDENYMPDYVPLFVWACFVLMWMEAVFGVCLGCKTHWLLAKVGIFKQECYSCNNIDFAAMALAAKKAEQKK